MTTLITLKNDIDEWLARDDISTSGVAATIIRMTEAVLARRIRVRDMETTTTLSATSRNTALPADYLDMRSVTLDSTQNRVLDYLTPETIRETNVWANTSGFPSAYTIEGSNVVLAPEPGASGVTVDIVYLAKYPALAADTDTNFLLANHYDMVLMCALLQACIYLKDYDAAPTYEALFEKSVAEIEKSEGRSRFMVGSALVSYGTPRAIV